MDQPLSQPIQSSPEAPQPKKSQNIAKMLFIFLGLMGIIVIASIAYYLGTKRITFYTHQNIVSSQHTLPANANGEIAFIRDGAVWLADDNGTHQTQLSFPSVQYCDFFSEYNSKLYPDRPIEFYNQSPWSLDGKSIAYSCLEKDGNDSKEALFVYNLEKKTTQRVEIDHSLPYSVTHQAGGNIDLAALDEKYHGQWDILEKIRPFDDPTTHVQLIDNYVTNGGYYVGNNIWLLDAFILNPINTPIEQWLYNSYSKKIIYRWSANNPGYQYNGSTYKTFYVIQSPQCSMNLQMTKIVCSSNVYLSDNDEDYAHSVAVLRVIDSTSGEILATKLGYYYDPIWSADGQNIYVTSIPNANTIPNPTPVHDSSYTKDSSLVIFDSTLQKGKVVIEDAIYPWPSP